MHQSLLLRGLKYASLMLAVASLLSLFWVFSVPEKHSSLEEVSNMTMPGGMIKAQGFHYTEYVDGKAAYKMSGEEVHDEHARIGSMRISVIKEVFVKHPQLNILVGAGKGWVLTAREGKMLGSRKKLTLTGNVLGRSSNGGAFSANKVLVDIIQGSVQLKDGYELKTLRRNERGILTSL
ncbi:MAG: LPS export ABC transporter periplasmic protein LptC [Mariprofundus sp.]|nr:LPS export ABC transporter periplasmic protein LptC [Mariprofundus sp.]